MQGLESAKVEKRRELSKKKFKVIGFQSLWFLSPYTELF